MKRPDFIAGAIYDVDDTLLDNQQGTRDPRNNLHELAQLGAYHTLAEQDPSYASLIDTTIDECLDGFHDSPVHTAAGAVYMLLKKRGYLHDEMDMTDPLMRRVLALKNATYHTLLQKYGQPIPGADTFVYDLADEYGLNASSAIASAAQRDDIQTFLEKYHLTELFPDERIIDISKVTRPKPDPEVFDKAFRSLLIDDQLRANTLAFEDDPRGMIAARKAGLYVCAITTRYTREQLQGVEARPDLIADSYDEFRDYFAL